MIEKGVLAAISESGVGSVDRQLDARPVLQTFTEIPPFHLLEKDGDLYLMVPSRFNYDAIDAILVKRTDGKTGKVKNEKVTRKTIRTKAKKTVAGVIHLFPIQVTIAQKHSDSVSHFFSRWWEQYREALLQTFPTHSVKVTFIWIDEAPQPRTTGTMPDGQHSRVHTEYDVVHVLIKSLLPDIDPSHT